MGYYQYFPISPCSYSKLRYSSFRYHPVSSSIPSYIGHKETKMSHYSQILVSTHHPTQGIVLLRNNNYSIFDIPNAEIGVDINFLSFHCSRHINFAHFMQEYLVGRLYFYFGRKNHSGLVYEHNFHLLLLDVLLFPYIQLVLWFSMISILSSKSVELVDVNDYLVNGKTNFA